jgi:diacylglycerol kinase
LQERLASIRNGFRGWDHALRTQQNARIHAVITALVLVLGLWVGLPTRDWSIIIVTAAIVFAAEFLNTAVELVVDLVSPQKHPLARAAKDVGAAAVLVTALAAILIGLLILGPPLLEKLLHR